MKGYALLFCCALLVSVASCASFNLPTIGKQVVEVWSDWYFVSEHGLDDIDGASITITADPDDVDISPATLHFDNSTREASFRIRPQDVDQYTITFSFDDGTNEVRFVNAVNRTITMEGLPSATLTLGYPSEPYQVLLDYPSVDDLVVVPVSSTGSVVFQPSEILIPGGAVAASFRVIANVPELSTVSYIVKGFEASFYSPIAITYINSIYPRSLMIGDLSSYTRLGQNSTNFYVYTPIPNNTTLTVTPVAVDTVFTPHSVDLTSSTRIASFSYVSSSPAYGARAVYFDLSGPGAANFLPSESKSTTITKKPITIQAPSSFVLHKKTYMSVRLGSTVTKDFTLYLYSGNLLFSPNNITFKGDTTSEVIEVTPQAVGQDVISFNVDGSDKDWYTIPADISLSVVGGTFFSPNSWYVPWLWIGVESPQIPVRISIAPESNVTLIPQAPDLIFTPTRLTFSASDMIQYFTITPAYTNKAASDPSVTTATVSFIVDGAEYSSFVAPDPIAVNVGRRSLQFRWSAHVTETTVGVKDLYLKKQYEFWATALYAPPANLSVIPTNSYMTFEPSVLYFGPDVSHIKVTATVNAIGGSTNIDWIIGGKCGGLYTTPAPQPVNLMLRPLALYKALIAPNDHVYGGYVADFTNVSDSVSYLGVNHVYWFSLRSNVIPDKSVTITPKSKHIEFNPPSFEFTFADALLNVSKIVWTTNYVPFNVSNLYVMSDHFNVMAQAPGRHEVWFELSGPDAPYYDIPDNIWVMSTQEMRLATEQQSSATVHVVSLTLLLISILYVLL